MRTGIVLPTRGIFLRGGEPDIGLLARLAVRAEELGIDGVWVGDSLIAKPRLEPLTVLAAISTCTKRVTLGTSVLLAALRQPVALAQTTATLHRLSQGRLRLGIGVGGVFDEAQRSEWKAASIDPHARGRRTTEVVDVVQRLWAGRPVSFQGQHVELDNVSLGYSTGDGARPVVLLACHSGENRTAQYARAARLADGLISISDTPDEFASVRRHVLDLVNREGRDESSFGSTFYMTVNLNPDAEVARAESDAWIRSYYGTNFWGERWGPFGHPESVLDRAKAYRDAGADELIFRFAAANQMEQLELLAQSVLPDLR